MEGTTRRFERWSRLPVSLLFAHFLVTDGVGLDSRQSVLGDRGGGKEKACEAQQEGLRSGPACVFLCSLLASLSPLAGDNRCLVFQTRQVGEYESCTLVVTRRVLPHMLLWLTS